MITRLRRHPRELRVNSVGPVLAAVGPNLIY